MLMVLGDDTKGQNSAWFSAWVPRYAGPGRNRPALASAAVPSYHLEERDSTWLARAPLVVSNEVSLPASSDQVFALLADIGNWQAWCTGVSETVVVGPLTTGVGARRKVRAGGVRFEERFLTWEDGVRVTFSGLTTSAPGFRSLVEDWAVVPDLADPTRSVLTQTMGVALRPSAPCVSIP
jgi:hypothetical protein